MIFFADFEVWNLPNQKNSEPLKLLKMAVFEILDWEKLISRKIWGPTRFGRIVPVAKVDNTENHFSEIHTHMTHIRTENNKLQKKLHYWFNSWQHCLPAA